MNEKSINLTLQQDEVDWLLRVIRIAKHETENRKVERYIEIFAREIDDCD